MKNRLSILFIGFGFLLGVKAQSLTVIDANGQDISGDTIVTNIDISEYDISADVGLKNSGPSQIDVNVTRYEVDVLAQTSSFFCWGSCTGVSTSGSVPEQTPSGSIGFASQEEMPQSNGFRLHYDPNYQEGNSLFRVKFFDINNPGDSVNVYFLFSSSDQLSANEISTTNEVQIYPNPANQQSGLYLKSKQNLHSIQLLDLQGGLIKSFQANSTMLNLQNVSKGTYILRLSNDNRVNYKKIVIQ